MTWNSGACSEVKGGGSAFVSDGDDFVRINDADVQADEAERNRELALVGGPDGDECGDDCTCGDGLGARP